MPYPEVVRFAELRKSAWKNGGGVTREIAASPAGAGVEQFDWRVSIADIDQPGPFSRFTGVDRLFVLLEGIRLTLNVGGTDHPLTRLVPFGFDGNSETSCRPAAGSCRVLNIMTRSDRYRASVEVVAVEAGHEWDGSEAVLLVLSDTLTAQLSGSQTISLQRMDALHMSAGDRMAFLDDGQVARIDLFRVG